MLFSQDENFSPTLFTTLGRRNNFKLLLSMCEIRFYYYQESLNRFPLPRNLFLADCSGKAEFFAIITYFPNEIASWFSQFFILAAIAISHYWFLKWDFPPVAEQFLSVIFYCHEKLRQFFKKMSDIFLLIPLSSMIRIALTYIHRYTSTYKLYKAMFMVKMSFK